MDITIKFNSLVILLLFGGLVACSEETDRYQTTEVAAPCEQVTQALEAGAAIKDPQEHKQLIRSCFEKIPSESENAQYKFALDYLVNQRTYLPDEDLSPLAEKLGPRARQLVVIRQLQLQARMDGPEILPRIQDLRSTALGNDDDLSHSALLHAEGLVSHFSGEHENAVRFFRDATAAADSENAKLLVPGHLLYEARAHHGLRDSDAALAAFAASANLMTQTQVRSLGRNLCRGVRSVLISSSSDRMAEYETLREQSLAEGNKVFATCVLIGQMVQAMFVSEFDEVDRLGESALLATSEAGLEDQRHIVLFTLGQNAYKKGEFAEALEFYDQALKGYESLSDTAAQSIVYNSLGNIFFDLGDGERAIEAYQAAYDLLMETNVTNHAQAATMLANIGLSHAADGNHDVALEFYRQADELAAKNPGHRVHGYLNYILAKSLHETGESLAAIDRASAAIPVIMDKRNRVEAAAVHSWIASRYLEAGRNKNAAEELRHATVIVKEMTDRLSTLDDDPPYSFWRSEYHQNMAHLMKEMDDHAASSEHALTALRLSNDRFEKQKVRAAANADVQFVLREKDRSIAMSRRDAELSSLKLEQARMRTYFSFGGSFLALAAAFLAFLAYRSQRKLAVINKLFLRETHHRAKNNLQILTALLRSKNRQDNPQSRAVAARLDAASRLTTMGLIQDHLFSRSKDDSLNTKSFVESLLNLIEEGFGSKGITFTSEIETAPLDADAATPLGLLISEIVLNALKHAFPSGKGEIAVRLKTASSGRINLSIKDNGSGFEPDQAKQSETSLGLGLITDLADQLGASLSITSNSNGTHYALKSIVASRS